MGQKKALEPFTEDELNDFLELPDSSTVEAVFCCPDFDSALVLVELLFTTEFSSVFPSMKLADVAIVRPEDSENGIIVVGTTGSQRVRQEDFRVFEDELEEVAAQAEAELLCAGSDLSSRVEQGYIH